MNNNTSIPSFLSKYRIFMVPLPLGTASFPQFQTDYLNTILTETKYWVVENTRTARRFFSACKLGIDIENLIFIELHKNLKEAEINAFLKTHIQLGNVGVCSEAGLPGLADPGYQVVQWAHENEVEVEPLVGPSSIVLSLIASGLNGQQFTFHGYAPIKEPELRSFIAEAVRAAVKTGYTQIFIEAPYRSDRFLKMILQTAQNDVMLCLGVNLHSENQWIATKSVAYWKKNIPEIGKIPCVFLLGSRSNNQENMNTNV